MHDNLLAPVGVGVALAQDTFGVFVREVYHGGPAHLSGQIASLDYLESVDGVPVVGAAEAQDRLLGPLGTVVVARVRQGAGGDSANVPLLRQDVDVGDGAGGAVGIAAALRVVRDGVLVDKVCARANARTPCSSPAGVRACCLSVHARRGQHACTPCFLGPCAAGPHHARHARGSAQRGPAPRASAPAGDARRPCVSERRCTCGLPHYCDRRRQSDVTLHLGRDL
jgi:hypothetical protein